jgi:hypothetical protein
LIGPRLHREEQVTDMERAISAAMDARVQFFNGILRQIEAQALVLSQTLIPV